MAAAEIANSKAALIKTVKGKNMSHTMPMTVLNQSSQTLSSYNVSHDWDGNVNACAGTNLLVNQSSFPVTITTGYTQHDYYTVNITFADGSTFDTKFYCDSSHDQTSVVIQINNNDCNCVYYKDGGVETGCYNKG